MFSSAALVATTAGQAAADTSKTLPVSSVGDMVVDGVHQKVFISDPSGGKLVVTDYAGTVLATVPNLPGVRGLEIAGDSSRVFAAVSGNDSIVAVNTEAPTEIMTYDLGADAPGDLAQAGGKLWFAYAGAQLGSLDLSGAEPVVTLAHSLGETNPWSSGATLLLGSDPGAPNVLAIGDRDSSPTTLGVYDVSAGTPQLKASKSGQYGSLQELDVTPDGQNVITSSGSPYYHPAFSTTDLSEVTRYSSNTYPNAVDIAPDGTIAGGTSSWYEPDLHVYKPGKTMPVREYDFPASNGSTSMLDTGALAWAPDSSKLFAVSNASGVRTLRVFDGPAKSVPTITIKAPATATRGAQLTVTGTVTATLPLPAGTPLTVTRYDLDSPLGKSLGTKTLGANGAYSFTDTPTAGGNVTYKVEYAGDAEHTGASVKTNVSVSRTKTALTLDRNGTTVNFNTPVWFTATLGPTYKNREVEIWADPLGPEPKKLLRRGLVNSEGKLAAQLKMTRDTWVSVTFAGDARNAPAEARSGVYTRAGVTNTTSRHYQWTKIGGVWYRTYHQTTDPLISAWHNSYPGRSTRLDLQVWYEGTWQSVASEYFALNSNGMAYVSLDGDGAAGLRFRVRAAYIDGAAGDNVNTTVYGAWQYFNFTR
ncbi:Ig-like domain-containing protein [Streptomyces sp. NPDC004787]|uniref:Ig-like domain-containing protein n=1 Tax=Streptomyces sp. NPDC004787 TaxID=3154291 RepID=UPI0033B73147